MRKVIALTVTLAIVATTLATLSAGTLRAAPVQAQGKDTQVRGKKTQAKPDFFADLALNQEQKDALKANREATRRKMAQLRELMLAKRQELNAEFQKETLDKRKLNAVASDIKKISGQLLDLRIQGVVFLKETLTAEQFARFQEKMKQLQAQIAKSRNKMMQPKKTGQQPEETDDLDIGKAGIP
ncbi:MAG: periplasmic heavy metal sensor [Candidatus Omnitrophica bacterium]|nr:periplasmic heavy metal sensor [Candidatus Omnitrophota bacterium]